MYNVKEKDSNIYEHVMHSLKDRMKERHLVYIKLQSSLQMKRLHVYVYNLLVPFTNKIANLITKVSMFLYKFFWKIVLVINVWKEILYNRFNKADIWLFTLSALFLM